MNTEAKIMMIDHAVDRIGVKRVTIKTDARNARSRASIERLGAQHDGVLRAHMPASDGGIRDTAVYSLLADEWPAARAALAKRLRPD
jgi:RimJ/RimL family protein N-acetyltransferase